MRKSDRARGRVAGGTDDSHGAGIGRGQFNEASTEPRRHPMPNRTDEMVSRGGKQAKQREPPRPRRIAPPVVSMRRGGERDAMGRHERRDDEAKRSGKKHEQRHAEGGDTQPSIGDEMTRGRSVETYGGEHQASRGERRTARRHERRDDHSPHCPRRRDDDGQASRIDRRGGYHMSKLSASHHPVSNTRRHDNRDDDDATPHEAKHPTAGRRETANERSERAARGDDEQANRPAARSRKSTSARASHDPEGGGLHQASRSTRAGERGSGERKRMMMEHGT